MSNITPFRVRTLNRSHEHLTNSKHKLQSSPQMLTTIDKLQVLALEEPKLARWLIEWFAMNVDRHASR